MRLLPGVMGNAEAHQNDSFENGLLEHALYTQPRDWQGMQVPEILTSGDHGKIAEWRQTESEAITKARRQTSGRNSEGQRQSAKNALEMMKMTPEAQ